MAVVLRALGWTLFGVGLALYMVGQGTGGYGTAGMVMMPAGIAVNIAAVVVRWVRWRQRSPRTPDSQPPTPN